jgi:hypothetical protein
MRIRRFAVACGIALFTGATVAAAQGGASAASADQDGMVNLRSKLFDAVYLLPGADFRSYTKVMLGPTQAAMAPNWLRDMNFHPVTILTKVTAEDGAEIEAQARVGLGHSFRQALKSAGYEIVEAPGAGVLRLSPRVFDLYVRAPRRVTESLPASRVRTANAGEATLALEARDSTTGALLWRVVDRRTAGLSGNFGLSIRNTTPNSNRFEFGNLFDAWAQNSVKTLEQLKAQSPVATASAAR